MPLSTETTLPPEVCDRSAWYGAELAGRGDWIEHLSEDEIAEVEGALRGLGNAGSLAGLSYEVPLPTLGPRLRGLLDEVLNGRGFVLIRSLPVERWTRREAEPHSTPPSFPHFPTPEPHPPPRRSHPPTDAQSNRLAPRAPPHTTRTDREPQAAMWSQLVMACFINRLIINAPCN